MSSQILNIWSTLYKRHDRMVVILAWVLCRPNLFVVVCESDKMRTGLCMLDIGGVPPFFPFPAHRRSRWAEWKGVPVFLNQFSFIPKRKIARLEGSIIRGGQRKPRARGQAGTASAASDTGSLGARVSEPPATAPRGGPEQPPGGDPAERTLTAVVCAGRVRVKSGDN